jgi:hypothetical protein
MQERLFIDEICHDFQFLGQCCIKYKKAEGRRQESNGKLIIYIQSKLSLVSKNLFRPKTFEINGGTQQPEKSAFRSAERVLENRNLDYF